MRASVVAACVAVTALSGLIAADGGRADRRLLEIPPGYFPRVVLRVPYGPGKGEVGVRWGGGGEGRDAVSVSAIRVVGDRLYLFDGTSSTIKVFRGPRSLLSESPRLTGSGTFVVSPDHRVYALGVEGAPGITCFDVGGKTVWTKPVREILPAGTELGRIGVASVSDDWFVLPQWTGYGLSALVQGRSRDGNRVVVRVTMDAQGRPGPVFPGTTILAPDRNVYELDRVATGPLSGDLVKSPVRILTRRGPNGEALGRVRLNYAPDRGEHPRPGERIARTQVDAMGGFVVETHIALAHRVPLDISARLDPLSGSTSIQKRLWRFDARGKLRDVWGFPSVTFNSGDAPAVVAADGSVYYLKHGATGIEVVRYTKK